MANTQKLQYLATTKLLKEKLVVNLVFCFLQGLLSTNSIPINTVTEADDTKKCYFFSSYIYCTKNGISINAPNINKSMPIEKKTVLLLFIFDVGGYLNIFEIQHNKTLLYLYFTYKI